MEQVWYDERKLLPLPVIQAARAGNPLAMCRVLQHYDAYICRLCIWIRYDRKGKAHLRINRQKRRQLQNTLVQAVLNMP